MSSVMAVAGSAGGLEVISKRPGCSVDCKSQLLIALDLNGHE